MNHWRSAWIIAACLALPTLSIGEIFKLAIPSDQGLQLYWWPVLPEVFGWQHDEGASQQYGINALVPVGSSFSAAPAVMYGKALYKTRMPQTKSLEQLIGDDRAQFAKDTPRIAISELPLMQDGDGKPVRCLSFSPPANGNWELVAYSEEGDFYLLFTVSAQSQRALADARSAFEQLVSHYKEKLPAASPSGTR